MCRGWAFLEGQAVLPALYKASENVAETLDNSQHSTQPFRKS
jgi:hypothetical protein